MKIIVTNSEACSMLAEKLSAHLGNYVDVEIAASAPLVPDVFSGADFARLTEIALRTKRGCPQDNWKIPTIKAVRDASKRGVENSASYVVLGLSDAKRFVETLFPY